MARITTWFGTVRKAVANGLVMTGAWVAGVVDSKPAGVTSKEGAALLVIWIGVAVVYLTGNDTPAAPGPSDASTLPTPGPTPQGR